MGHVLVVSQLHPHGIEAPSTDHDVLRGLSDASHTAVQTHARELTLQLEGEAKRLCQQCSTFHPLADFDGTKR